MFLDSTKKTKLREAIKKKDGWWATIFSGPLANRLLEPLCEISWVSPNLITITSLFIGLMAAWCFADGDHNNLVVGAFLVQLSFTVDCMDGQLARYRQQFSKLGAWLDRVSDRFKDFLYFFALAWGFYTSHYGENFQLSFAVLNNLLEKIFSKRDLFMMPADLQMLLMYSISIPKWIIWPLAMIAMFAILLIDYYVNQDMKLEPRALSLIKSDRHCEEPSKRSEDGDVAIHPSKVSKSPIVKVMQFGLSVYRAIPILRFNIGEQALLITIFTALDMVFVLMLVFAGLGTFYVFYWPVAKYLGFSPEK